MRTGNINNLISENGKFINVIIIGEQTLTAEEQAIIKANLGIENMIITYAQSTGADTKIAMSQDAVTRELGKYVLAIEGLGLSEQSFTLVEKEKLALLKNYDDATITAAITALQTGKANKTDVYTKLETDTLVSRIYTPKGSIASYSLLPTENNNPGDTYSIEDEAGLNYFYTDSGEWDSLGAVIDLTQYALKTEIPDEVSDLLNDMNYVADANYVHTDENFTTELKEDIEEIPNKQDKVTTSTITNAEAGEGVVLINNNELIISDNLTGITVTSVTGSGMISFTAGANTLFTLPGDAGWDGDITPTFVENLLYKVLYIDGTFFSTKGRTKA